MVGPTIILALLPALVACSGEGNIRLLEDEIAIALKACSFPNDNSNPRIDLSNRHRRSNDKEPGIDDNTKPNVNEYGHERRKTDNLREQMQGINATGYDYTEPSGDKELMVASETKNTAASSTVADSHVNNLNRTKRNEPLFNKPDSDQCLSQCVFANLQVVDSRGIPREAELWNIVQSSVTSQQSRAALRDQISACFQELQTEAEDNGCSYSNKLERCLMLRFTDRKIDAQGSKKKFQPQA